MAQETTNYDLIKPEYEDVADIQDINDNMDSLDTIIAGLKTKQTAKTSPTASGTASQFIDTVSQDANGVITATKKTVRTMTGATSSAAGATGLVPAPGTADTGKYLKGDGTWGTPTNTTYSTATADTLGLVKIGYTASGKNYPVQLSSGKMYVNVPWTDNNTTYSQATSSTLGLVKIGYTESGKNYPVQLNNSGQMFVNVPWTDNNTTYSEATSSAYGLIKIGYSASGKNYPVQLSGGKAYVNVPWTDTTYANATTSAAGLMSKDDKTKLDGIAAGAQKNPGAATADAYGLIKIGYSASGKNYPVQLSSGKAFVNVPWSDTTYSAATSDAYGLIKIGYTQSGKNYPVQLSSGKAFVNVPWTDTNTTYSQATSSALGLIKIGYTSNLKNYAVQLDTSGKAFVNVPWANTTYSQGDGIIISSSNVVSRAPLMTSPAGTYGPTANVTGTDGTTIKIPQITVNSFGDITGVTERTLTNKNTWRGFAVQSFSYDYTIAANGTKDITGTNFGVGKSGYTPVAVCMFNPGHTSLYVSALNGQATGSNTVMTVKNTSSSSISPQAWIAILYLQN